LGATDIPPQLLYSAKQASERLGKDERGRPLVSAYWLERRAAARSIPCTYIGRRLCFSEANLLALVEGGDCDPKNHRFRRGPTKQGAPPR
jgi:hypothetical protein